MNERVPNHFGVLDSPLSTSKSCARHCDAEVVAAPASLLSGSWHQQHRLGKRNSSSQAAMGFSSDLRTHEDPAQATLGQSCKVWTALPCADLLRSTQQVNVAVTFLVDTDTHMGKTCSSSAFTSDQGAFQPFHQRDICTRLHLGPRQYASMHAQNAHAD